MKLISFALFLVSSVALAAGNSPFIINQTCANGAYNIITHACDGGAFGGVDSLNGLAGDLSLIAGTNITLTPSGSTITISSSGSGPSSLTSSHIFVGNGSNVATDVALSGDATMANTGAMTIANNAITNVKILNGTINDVKLVNMPARSVKANITGSPQQPVNVSLNDFVESGSSIFTITNGVTVVPENTGNMSIQANLAAGKIYVGSAGGFPVAQTPSGGVTMNNSGVFGFVNGSIDLTTKVTNILPVASGGSGAGSFTSGFPLTGNGTGAFGVGGKTGNSTKFVTNTGTNTSGHCTQWDASGNLVDAGAACGTSGGSPGGNQFDIQTNNGSGGFYGDDNYQYDGAGHVTLLSTGTGSFPDASPAFTINDPSSVGATLQFELGGSAAAGLTMDGAGRLIINGALNNSGDLYQGVQIVNFGVNIMDFGFGGITPRTDFLDPSETDSLSVPNRIAYDNAAVLSHDWQNRFFDNEFGITVLAYSSTSLGASDNSGTISIGFGDRILYDSSGDASHNYNLRQLIDSSANESLDYNNRVLFDQNVFNSVDYSFDRTLNNQDGDPVLQWDDGSHNIAVFPNGNLYLSPSVDINIQPSGNTVFNGTGDVSFANGNDVNITPTNNVAITPSGSLNLGHVDTYNAIATVANGLVPVRGSFPRTAQTTSLGPSTIYSPINNGSMFLVCMYLETTTTAVAGTLSGNIIWTGDNGSHNQQVVAPISLTTGTTGNGCVFIKGHISTNIQYQTTLTGVTGSPQYSISVDVLQIEG